MSQSWMGRLLLAAFSALLVVVAFGLGFGSALLLRAPGSAPEAGPVPEGIEPPENFALYNEVWRYVDAEFYGGRPAAQNITQRAVEGLVAALDDPLALYLSADQRDGAGPELLAMRYEPHLGMWLEPTAQGTRVLAVQRDGAADEAGLVAGDLILTAAPPEDETTQDPEPELVDPSAAEALEELIGPNGEEDGPDVLQTLEEADEPLEVVAVRRGRAAVSVVLEPRIGGDRPVPVALEQPEDDVLLVRLATIDQDSAAALEEAVASLDSEVPSSVIVDLRDNPGGDATAAARIAGQLVDGPLWIESSGGGQSQSREAEDAPGGGLRDAERIVVLVNGGTVGAAEMLAAALAERRGAVLVGQPSFGRSTIPGVRELRDGALLRLSQASWSTPDGLSVVDGGLEPDRAVEGRQEQLAEALAAAAGMPAAEAADTGGD